VRLFSLLVWSKRCVCVFEVNGAVISTLAGTI
jgi:hypothetical protein